MLITSEQDFAFFEHHVRKCLNCDTNFCSIMKSRPYKLFRLRVLSFLNGTDVGDTKVFFFLNNFALHMYPHAPGSLVVDVEWTDPMAI